MIYYKKEGEENDNKGKSIFKKFSYDEIIKRDKVSLDITWLKDESLESLENLPEPEILADEIVDNLETALDSFKNVQTELQKAE